MRASHRRRSPVLAAGDFLWIPAPRLRADSPPIASHRRATWWRSRQSLSRLLAARENATPAPRLTTGRTHPAAATPRPVEGRRPPSLAMSATRRRPNRQTPGSPPRRQPPILDARETTSCGDHNMWAARRHPAPAAAAPWKSPRYTRDWYGWWRECTRMVRDLAPPGGIRRQAGNRRRIASGRAGHSRASPRTPDMVAELARVAPLVETRDFHAGRTQRSPHPIGSRLRSAVSSPGAVKATAYVPSSPGRRLKEAYAVRRTVPPSAEIEARIDELLAVGVGENPRESLSELAKLGARLIIQRAVEDEFDVSQLVGLRRRPPKPAQAW